MAIKSNIEMTGSKYFAILIVFIAAFLSAYLKDGSIWISSSIAAIGLYANKQYQDRMKTKYKEETT